MNEAELISLQQRFHAFDLRDRQVVLDALVEVFRPSDFRHLSSRLFPESFVGDFVQILPPEISDIIFSHLEPQSLYRLRNVSTLWNAYLSRPEFLRTMDLRMYSTSSPYVIDVDSEYVETASFEDKVRNRAALLNGRSHSFGLIRHKAGNLSTLAYCLGNLLNYSGPRIYVMQLYREGSGWHGLVGDDLESFTIVQATPRFIIATTQLGVVYCWNIRSLDQVAKFRIPAMPFEVEASHDTIVLFCPDSWFLYSLQHQRLCRIDRPFDVHSGMSVGHVENNGFIYGLAIEGTIDTYKINESRTSLDFCHSVNINKVLLEETAMTDADHTFNSTTFTPNVVVVWNHSAFYSSPLTIKGAPTRVYSLQAGVLKYCHTIENDNLKASEVMYYPQIERAFDLICQHDRGMPLGMYQVHNDQWRPVTPGTYKSDPVYVQNEAQWSLPASVQMGDPSWALRYEDQEALWSGDANFAICSHPSKGFTRIWRFFRTGNHDDE